MLSTYVYQCCRVLGIALRAQSGMSVFGRQYDVMGGSVIAASTIKVMTG